MLFNGNNGYANGPVLHLYAHCLCQFSFADVFSKNTQIHFMKTRPEGAEVFHSNRQSDGQTDMTNLVAAFRNSANSSRSGTIFHTRINCSESQQ